MLPDPLVIVYDGANVSLARIVSLPDRSVYSSLDGQFRLAIDRSPPNEDGVAYTSYQLQKRTEDTSWENGENHKSMGVSGGVGVNNLRVDESSRTKLKAAAANFDTTFGSRLVGGEI